jgi:hypothetical protein
MLDAGYNFLLVDGDVYLTGSHHPLTKMRPLTDPTWDIQFQCDDWDGEHQDVLNIGWYWARPTDATREIFSRSQAEWDKTQSWDQNIVNQVVSQMTGEGKLAYGRSVVILNQLDYAIMDRLEGVKWEMVALDPVATDRLNAELTMLHITGFVHITKPYLAKHFGLYVNETYYRQPVSVLQPVNISGSMLEILQQMGVAIYLARSAGRMLMWPTSFNQSMGGDLFEERVGIIVVDDLAVANAISWVEATYIHNRAKYTNVRLTEETISIMVEDIQRDGWLDDMILRCRSSSRDVIKVDFGDVVAADIVRSASLAEAIREVPLWEKQKTWY